MKTVQDKDGNILQVADDTLCHAGKNGALPIMLDEVLDAAIFAEIAEREAKSQIVDEAFIYTLHAKYNQETITSSGAEFGVDDKTRASMTEAVLFLRDLGENAPATVDWSAENGFFELTLAQLETAILTIGLHRQKGFTARKILLAELTDTTTKDQVTTRFNTLVRG
jgi:hypothetical protein